MPAFLGVGPACGLSQPPPARAAVGILAGQRDNAPPMCPQRRGGLRLVSQWLLSARPIALENGRGPNGNRRSSRTVGAESVLIPGPIGLDQISYRSRPIGHSSAMRAVSVPWRVSVSRWTALYWSTDAYRTASAPRDDRPHVDVFTDGHGRAALAARSGLTCTAECQGTV